MSQILVTGAAGFIGFHVTSQLLEQGHHVTGIDNLNSHYSVQLKQDRLQVLQKSDQFEFAEIDLVDVAAFDQLFEQQQFDKVIHLAAEVGVRNSLLKPLEYVQSNVVGFVNLLEHCRKCQVQHLVYASSSSVYGANKKTPYATHDPVDHPVSLYAATKRADELIAHSYSHLYDLPTTGLRFFTVYGPWGRPDMAVHIFTKAILEGTPIKVFNHGNLKRDFTYVDDIVAGVLGVLEQIPERSTFAAELTPEERDRQIEAPYRLYNIGNHQPVDLSRLIEVIEQRVGKPAIRENYPMQPGDVLETYADISELQQATGFAPATSIEAGIDCFVEWYLSYYGTPQG
ncbi:NAD-dependent epimerase/dehydratase family protein [Gimesia benthica]|uniref:NAD-dependent epimerase/dehydratase family protein n=1 Tax=Gimesia benthica TaxID=2608982 RepID=A0A6I6A8L0_9PLAN|nr:NAD-dependent epimerase/dehydratase family protein [Gimesia benthica]QGQ22280.1 NAD-dependent epimerase/dehydratase family protein [Gimesia benthica]